MKKVLLALAAVSLVACGTPEEKYMDKTCKLLEESVAVGQELKDGKIKEKEAEEKVDKLYEEAKAYGKELGLKDLSKLENKAMDEKCPDIAKKYEELMR